MPSRRAFPLAAACAAALAWCGDARGAGPDPDPWLARDKALHFDACAGVAALAYAASAGWLVDARWEAIALGAGTAIVAGAGKELVDATHVFPGLGGDPSWKDLAWDAAGALAGVALAWGVDLALGGVSASRPAFAAPRPLAAGAGWTLRF